MHNRVFEHSDTPSFACLACIKLHINDKQFHFCSLKLSCYPPPPPLFANCFDNDQCYLGTRVLVELEFSSISGGKPKSRNDPIKVDRFFNTHARLKML